MSALCTSGLLFVVYHWCKEDSLTGVFYLLIQPERTPESKGENMPEDKNATPTETFSEITGKTEVDPGAFLTEDEGHVDENLEDNPTGDEPPEKQEDNPEKPDSEDPNKGDEPEDGEDDPNLEDKNKPEEKVYAGKYKTLDDLKAAFVELGGDPDDYQDPKMLEEAYKVRQSEYTRTHQNNLDKPNSDQPLNETPANVDEMVEKIFSETSEEASKIQNGVDLYKFTLKSVLQNLVPMLKNASPEELAKQVAPMIAKTTAERSAKETELREVETKVPRLRTDKKFRDAFAFHVRGLMTEKRYTNLDSAMKDFVQLTTGKPIDDQEKKNNLKDKHSAQPLPDNSDANTGQDTDEVDDILNAHNKHKDIFG